MSKRRTTTRISRVLLPRQRSKAQGSRNGCSTKRLNDNTTDCLDDGYGNELDDWFDYENQEDW